MKHRTILPGEFFVTSDPYILTTVLGSCVSACLFDPRTRIVGMNHFLLSNRRYAKHIPVCLTEASRYGIHSMEMVINEMLKLGAKRTQLQAKVFGGASFYQSSETADNFFCVGDVNCRFIREYLENEHIPLASADLGGNMARVIHFSSVDFSVKLKKKKSRGAAGLPVIRQERLFWRSRVELQEQLPATSDEILSKVL